MLDGDLTSALVAASSAGRRGTHGNRDFTELIAAAGHIATSDAGWKGAARAVHDVSVAAKSDSGLDLRAVLFVVDWVLRKAERESPGWQGLKLEGEVAKPDCNCTVLAAKSFRPYLGRWLRYLIMQAHDTENPGALEKARTVVVRWHERMFMPEADVIPLLSLLDAPPAKMSGGTSDAAGSARGTSPAASSSVRTKSVGNRSPSRIERCHKVTPPILPIASDLEESPRKRRRVSIDKAPSPRRPSGEETVRVVRIDHSNPVSVGFGLSPQARSVAGSVAAADRPLEGEKAALGPETTGLQAAVACQSTPIAREIGHQASREAPTKRNLVDEISVPSTAASQQQATEAFIGPNIAPQKRPRLQMENGKQPTILKYLNPPAGKASVVAGQPAGDARRASTTDLTNDTDDSQTCASNIAVQRLSYMPELWKVRGDCRCLFRCIYRALKDPHNKIARGIRGEPQDLVKAGHETQGADKLRNKLCILMRQWQDEICELMAMGKTDVEAYIVDMENPKTWGDVMCLRFLPEIINRPIQVYALNGDHKGIYDAGMYTERNPTERWKPPIVLWYNGKSHYDLVSERWLAAHEQACSQEPSG